MKKKSKLTIDKLSENLKELSDGVIVGDGILSQIMKEGNVVNYKPLDLNDPEEVKDFQERWKEFSKREDERMKNYKPTYPAYLLLSYPDDLFKGGYLSDDVIWLGGIDVHDAIEERAKKLGLIK